MQRLISATKKIGWFGIYRTFFGSYIVMNDRAKKFVGVYGSLPDAEERAWYEWDYVVEKAD